MLGEGDIAQLIVWWWLGFIDPADTINGLWLDRHSDSLL